MNTLYRGILSCALAVSLALAGVATASAEQKERAFTLSPMVGGYVYDGAENIKDDIQYSLGIGYNFTKSWGAEFVAGLTPTDIDEGNGDVDVMHFRMDGLYHFLTDNALVPYLAAGVGLQNKDYEDGSDDSEALFNWGGGIKYWLTERTALRADVRHLLTGEAVNNMSYSAGLAWQFAEAAKPEPRDSDGDGVPDERDQCPGTPRGVQVDNKGCPLDSDGDGVPDYRDKCPGTPKGVQVDDKGCPLDSDGDGVPDHLDQCPDTPKGASVDDKGCALDSDGDGVPDYRDKCPDTPAGELVDEDGCTLKMTMHINFDLDKTAIKPEYESELARAAAFIQKHRDVPYILVAGHTDSLGSESYNKDLSMRRAQAVVDYLVSEHGIDRKRLVARGYGEAQPVADNSTAEGRYQNRRVETICCMVLPPEE
ncbi:OmpA family protein [Geoalkalibacter subterraneus]|uniref:OmpA family protein n=1 Tax=Geoalkalibacter subterraneus TaxID=483547 RepID=UPI000693DB12|nr:OmpA family protein [Geoalkalibacter subterraneus]